MYLLDSIINIGNGVILFCDQYVIFEIYNLIWFINISILLQDS